ncbi:MAG: hypothetical protein MUE30_07855 [Spirosomaceae bacterium]|nr:hypothetical protein [Spirosomataceae bacterium]
MKRLTHFCSFLFVIFLMSCERTGQENPTPDSTTKNVLVTNPWKLEKITDANGNTINPDLLPAEGKAFFGVNIQFKEDKTVRAIDPVARQVVNGGVWDLLDGNKTLDIDLGANFKGKYPINALERSRMSLRNTMVFNGLKFDVNLELVPAL